MATITGRLVGVESNQRALTDSAAMAVQELVSQAKTEFQAQAQSLATLREQAQSEVLALRGYVNATRQAIEDLHSSWKAEFTGLWNTVKVQVNRTEDLAQNIVQLTEA
eukprot:1059702-Alexandrium_andersonii.AAC.1